MWKFLLKKWRKSQKRIRQSIGLKRGHTKSSDLSQQESIQELRKNLYDTPRKLNVETFYEIMEDGNLLLLMIDQKKEINANLLNEVWIELQDYYYSNTNEQSFNKFKRNLKNVVKIKSEITTCKAGLELVKLGIDEGYEILKNQGIRSEDIKSIISAISRKETKLDFAKNKINQNNKKEKTGFYTMVASVERGLGGNRQLNTSEINLERWVAYLDEIKIKNELEQKAANNSKRKRNVR